MFGVCFCVWLVEMNLMRSYVWTLEWCQVVFFNLCCDILKWMLYLFFLNNVQWMFYQASSFNNDISSWSTSRVRSMMVSLRGMRNMFGLCFCVMSQNEFDVELCMNFGMMSGCIFQFVLRHIKMNVWFLTMLSFYFVSFWIMYSTCLTERVPSTRIYVLGYFL